MKKVRCIDNQGGLFWLTIGKVYDVLGDTKDQDRRILVLNDMGGHCYYTFTAFEVVGCPCDVKKCIKHRRQ